MSEEQKEYVFNKLDLHSQKKLVNYLYKIKHEVDSISRILNEYESYCNLMNYTFNSSTFKCYYVTRLVPVDHKDLIVFEQEYRKMCGNDMFTMKVILFDYVVCEGDEDIVFTFNSDLEAVHSFMRGHNLYSPKKVEKVQQRDNYGYSEDYITRLLNSK